jgi:hypothetical protein
LAEFLKSIGIGWLCLVVMGILIMLSLELANGGRTKVYPQLLTIGLLASPGFLLLLAGLLVDAMRIGRQQGGQAAETVDEAHLPPGDAR